MYEATVRVLTDRGHKVSVLERSSKSVQRLSGKTLAFMQGIYSLSAKEALTSILTSDRPDVVHVHNLYPLLSPSVLVASREYNVPVVLRCADYRLICPTSHKFNQDGICERCEGGREYWCVLKNCRRNMFESIAYAARTAAARKSRLFLNNVTVFVAPSEFVKNRLVGAGFPEDRFFIVPNMSSVRQRQNGAPLGQYVAYAGRISPEKGIEVLLSGAARTGLPVRVAGEYSQMCEIAAMAPPNTRFLGHMDEVQLAEFYRGARYLVVPSTCLEAFGLVTVEAMSHGLPVIASRIGGLPEIVEDGVTGFLFEPGDSEELASKMTLLWENPGLCRKMGQAGKNKAIREYSEDVYYTRLMAVYGKAIAKGKEWSGIARS